MIGLGREILELEEEIRRIELDLARADLDPEERRDFRNQLQDAKSELKGAWEERIQSWQDCSRAERTGNYSQPEWIYLGLGELFKVPPKTVVRQILEVLDRDHLGWDDEKPKPNHENWFKTYFLTLETNFPEYVKQSRKGSNQHRTTQARRKKRGKNGGCLVVIFGLLLLVTAKVFFSSMD